MTCALANENKESIPFINGQGWLYSKNWQLIKAISPRTNLSSTASGRYGIQAVVGLYKHRCAVCGVRMLTVEGRTAVEAAHIIPWSVSHNDDVHNGIVLCRLCHWTFDEGLTGISKKYLVVLLQEMRISQNVAGHLLTLEGRSILGPAERDLWPDVGALGWHRENVFRGE